MGKEIITFGNIEVEKSKFHLQNSFILIYGANIDRIVVSNKVTFGKKGFEYFIGSKIDSEKIIALCIILPKTRANRRDFDESEYISLLIKNNELL